MVAISPQTVEQCRKAVEDFGVSFPLLADEGNEVAGRYGLTYQFPEDVRQVYREVFDVDLEEYNGDDSWSLPMPARYLVDPEATVRWASVSPDYTVRPDPEDTVRALDQLSAGQ